MFRACPALFAVPGTGLRNVPTQRWCHASQGIARQAGGAVARVMARALAVVSRAPPAEDPQSLHDHLSAGRICSPNMVVQAAEYRALITSQKAVPLQIPLAIDHQRPKPLHLDQVRLAVRRKQMLVLLLKVDLARHRCLLLLYAYLPPTTESSLGTGLARDRRET